MGEEGDKTMKSKIIRFLIHLFGIDQSLHALHVRQKCLETQLDYLLKTSNRKVRRKWYRMLTRKTSPFYIGELMGQR